jgi:hypothetical protein
MAVPLVALAIGIRSASLTAGFALMILGSLALIIRLISRGHNWARVVMLVLYALTALISLASLSITIIIGINALASGDGTGVAIGALILLQIAQIVLGGVANYFLFTLPGRLWFKRTPCLEGQ